MDIQNLIIYNYSSLFEILSELSNNLNFKITKLDQKDLKNFNEKEPQNFIFLTKEKVPDVNNQVILKDLPIRLIKLVEQLNIKFLKINYKDQSNFKVGVYTVDLNSKNFFSKNKNLKLTEKEINTIIYLFKKKKAVSIKELQIEVWDHKSLLETHTVETHIHRLRKKIKEKFDDDNLIISSKEGYSIN
jgi:hypothetical protein